MITDFFYTSVRCRCNGCNVAILDKIFDKFVQLKSTMESTPGSVGLGLSIAKEIVEMYGGSIWAESEEGKGSLFVFTIPKEGKK